MKKNYVIVIIAAIAVILIGLPNRTYRTPPYPPKHAEDIPHNNAVVADELSPIWEHTAPLGPPEKPKITERKRVTPQKGPLSEEEIEILKTANYPAYIRYQANLLDSNRDSSAHSDKVLHERIAPLLLEQLKKQETKKEKELS